jgi:hypothetical protein
MLICPDASSAQNNIAAVMKQEEVFLACTLTIAHWLWHAPVCAEVFG